MMLLNIGEITVIRAKNWKGDDLAGDWQLTLKIDGVRVLVNESIATSRTGKPLWNVPHDLPDGDYECYLGNFKDTISRVKTHNHPAGDISLEHFYSLDPLDSRLQFNEPGVSVTLGKDAIKSYMRLAVHQGYEGLILRKGDRWLKVKPFETHDVLVTGYQPGTGKHEGKMGALLTPMGKVGTGFKDSDREEFTEEYIVGRIIEVKCMQLTEAGKFRHPAFVRLRLDKD